MQDAAVKLAEWDASRQGLVVPIRIELPKQSTQPNGEAADATSEYFRDRARQVRQKIATDMGLDAKAAGRLTFTMTYRDAWYLGPRPNLNWDGMLDAVRATPEKFIELMLQKELIEEAAFDPSQTFVTGGFGPGVYLGNLGKSTVRRLHLAEVQFTVRGKYGQVLCDVASKVFAKKTKTGSEAASSATLPIDAGEGFILGVTRVVPSDYFDLDARRYPMTGISLDTQKFRQTRLYYLNVLTEFALKLFEKAGVPVESDTFVASHCVDDGYIPLEPLAQLQRPLIVVNATREPLTNEALKPLMRFPEFFPDGYHVAGNKRTQFAAPEVRALEKAPLNLDPALNYLYLNGASEDEDNSIRVAKVTGAALEFKAVRANAAYSALAAGGSVADPYTEAKFRHLMERDTVLVSTQGLDYCPSALARLTPGDLADDDRALQEALKRCLVELSLKEGLLGHKPVPAPTMPQDLLPASLTLLATRQIRMGGRQKPKQLVACVDVDLGPDGLSVTRVRRSPWSKDTLAAIDFVEEFPFLQTDGRELIGDGQFWVIDRATGERLTAWWGKFVPKLILNASYDGVEAALAAQEGHLEQRRQEGSKARFYSKDRAFNLLPYYMSMYLPAHQTHGERTGTRIALQDCGAFLRMFVPPAGGIVGAGDSLSGMRDVMVYLPDGQAVAGGLLDRKLVQLYLHTLTNGVLVGGDNSKMSMLEKLARLALEN
ncbi:hypothetical protein [Roseateles sp.]|uniref:hypothetical protein n=1 Tax=Roseateles sp. TaxID=1971397 RepID=UPI003BA5F89F